MGEDTFAAVVGSTDLAGSLARQGASNLEMDRLTGRGMPTHFGMGSPIT